MDLHFRKRFRLFLRIPGPTDRKKGIRWKRAVKDGLLERGRGDRVAIDHCPGRQAGIEQLLPPLLKHGRAKIFEPLFPQRRSDDIFQRIAVAAVRRLGDRHAHRIDPGRQPFFK